MFDRDQAKVEACGVCRSNLHVCDGQLSNPNPPLRMGIVSALGVVGSEGYDGFIQTNASTIPGKSGGALVNEVGVVVGINSAIIDPAGGGIGIWFAMPAETVAMVIRNTRLSLRWRTGSHSARCHATTLLTASTRFCPELRKSSWWPFEHSAEV